MHFFDVLHLAIVDSFNLMIHWAWFFTLGATAIIGPIAVVAIWAYWALPNTRQMWRYIGRRIWRLH